MSRSLPPTTCLPMGWTRWSIGLLLLAAWMGSPWSHAMAQSGTRRPVPRPTAKVTAPKGIAVVELFTSQGCNSCPPADASLRQIADVAGKQGLPVYVLSFHVDYWNRLGWNDPYSDPSYSQRQRAYASATGSRRVYTPQMIVSGTTEFVGSDKAKAHNAIMKGLQRKSRAHIKLAVASGSTHDQLSVRFATQGATSGKVLNVAVVETPPANQVPRGENAGRKLSHVNVVRSFDTVPLSESSGQVDLTLPEDWKPDQAEIIAYVQDPDSMLISGATAIPLRLN